MIINVNPDNPQRRLIRRAAEVLRGGGVIIYPTDTQYGIGCDIFEKKAVERIYRLKNKKKEEPLSFVCADLNDLSQYARHISNYAYRSMKRCLPGPYTFILRASKLVPKIMVSKGKTVGIRVPDNKICLEIVRELGHPIANTSVTSSEDEILSDPIDMEEKFGRLVDLIVGGGVLLSERSSMVDLTEEEPEVLRVGKGDVRLFLGA